MEASKEVEYMLEIIKLKHEVERLTEINKKLTKFDSERHMHQPHPFWSEGSAFPPWGSIHKQSICDACNRKVNRGN